MKSIPILLSIMSALFLSTAVAQHSAYSGQEKREIKALSNEEIHQYRSGAGMGYARAAELNAFPGPMHVLELSDKLSLSPEQRAVTQRLMNEHKSEARALGEKLVEAERVLDLLFASGHVDEATLAAQVRQVAAAQGDYRLSHLETHRRTRALLSDQQVRRYDELRGYAGGRGAQKHHENPRH